MTTAASASPPGSCTRATSKAVCAVLADVAAAATGCPTRSSPTTARCSPAGSAPSPSRCCSTGSAGRTASPTASPRRGHRPPPARSSGSTGACARSSSPTGPSARSRPPRPSSTAGSPTTTPPGRTRPSRWPPPPSGSGSPRRRGRRSSPVDAAEDHRGQWVLRRVGSNGVMSVDNQTLLGQQRLRRARRHPPLHGPWSAGVPIDQALAFLPVARVDAGRAPQSGPGRDPDADRESTISRPPAPRTA